MVIIRKNKIKQKPDKRQQRCQTKARMNF